MFFKETKNFLLTDFILISNLLGPRLGQVSPFVKVKVALNFRILLLLLFWVFLTRNNKSVIVGGGRLRMVVNQVSATEESRVLGFWMVGVAGSLWVQHPLSSSSSSSSSSALN